MNNIWTLLSGKKTYIVSAIGIAYLWAQVWIGVIDQQTAIAGTLAALGLSSVRHGISSTAAKGPKA